jgi:hypothetical protein
VAQVDVPHVRQLESILLNRFGRYNWYNLTL